MLFTDFVFYTLAAILLLAGLRVITTRNPVHAALNLVLAFFTAAGIWLLLEAEFLAIDPEALLALRSALAAMPELNRQYLSTISSPCLIYCGDADPRYTGTKEAADYIPGARFVSLPGLDHKPAFAQSGVILPHIKEFLTQVSKT